MFSKWKEIKNLYGIKKEYVHQIARTKKETVIVVIDEENTTLIITFNKDSGMVTVGDTLGVLMYEKY